MASPTVGAGRKMFLQAYEAVSLPFVIETTSGAGLPARIVLAAARAILPSLTEVPPLKTVRSPFRENVPSGRQVVSSDTIPDTTMVFPGAEQRPAIGHLAIALAVAGILRPGWGRVR
jgi:hypothetical protein